MAKGGVCFVFSSIFLVFITTTTCCFSTQVPRRQRQDAPEKHRPVIFVHGILPEPDEWKFPQSYITQHIPGIEFYNIDLYYDKIASTLGLRLQLKSFIPAIQKVMDKHNDTGVTLLCYSQGGVICRAVVEMVSTHNIHTMITLSSPLAGQFGLTSEVEKAIPFLPYSTRELLYLFFYTEVGQDVSVGGYWNDPHHQKEFADPKLDVLVAHLNNQTGHETSQEYKKNFLKLQNLVMITGPNDTVITPYQSAHFGYYDSNEVVQPMEKQLWYVGDDFGLKTLNEAGKVIRKSVSGVQHKKWHLTAKVFDCCVLPYL